MAHRDACRQSGSGTQAATTRLRRLRCRVRARARRHARHWFPLLWQSVPVSVRHWSVRLPWKVDMWVPSPLSGDSRPDIDQTSIRHFRVGSISNRYWSECLCYMGRLCRSFSIAIEKTSFRRSDVESIRILFTYMLNVPCVSFIAIIIHLQAVFAFIYNYATKHWICSVICICRFHLKSRMYGETLGKPINFKDT